MQISKIKQIKKIKVDSQRYDLEVEDNHNFFANGILVHNSNVSVWYDRESGSVRLAKRSGFIEKDENFYNIDSIRERLEEYVSKVANRLPDATQIVLYGELFGGSYPDHKSNTKAVQKGVYYSPNLEFFVFDIAVDGEFMDSQDRWALLHSLDIPMPHVKKVGTFEECLEESEVFEDPTYEVFGLPKVEDNFSEGLVIKPCKPKFYPCGSRVILKKKNEKFSEKTNKKKREQKTSEPVSEEIQKEIDNILPFVTEARLRNVLSHIGEVTQKDFGKVMKEFNKDVIEDYRKDHGETFDNLDKKDSKIVTSALNKSAANLIRQNFLDIIDGNF